MNGRAGAVRVYWGSADGGWTMVAATVSQSPGDGTRFWLLRTVVWRIQSGIMVTGRKISKDGMA